MDRELLSAISDMMDEKLHPIKTQIGELYGMKEDVQGLKQDVRELREDVDGLKKDVHVLKEDVHVLKEDVQVLKEDVQVLKEDVHVLQEDMQEVKGRVKKIELTQENVILPRLQNIEECYVSTYERYQKNCDEHEEMKQDISMLKEVVEKHSLILQRIS